MKREVGTDNNSVYLLGQACFSRRRQLHTCTAAIDRFDREIDRSRSARQAELGALGGHSTGQGWCGRVIFRLARKTSKLKIAVTRVLLILSTFDSPTFRSWPLRDRSSRADSTLHQTHVQTNRCPSPRSPAGRPLNNGTQFLGIGALLRTHNPMTQPQQSPKINNPQAHVEEIIERIRATPSVETYVICDSAPGGAIYRRAPGTTEERAAAVAEALRPVASKAQGVVRDLDPAVRLLRSGVCMCQLRRVVCVSCLTSRWLPKPRRTSCSLCGSRPRSGSS